MQRPILRLAHTIGAYRRSSLDCSPPRRAPSTRSAHDRSWTGLEHPAETFPGGRSMSIAALVGKRRSSIIFPIRRRSRVPPCGVPGIDCPAPVSWRSDEAPRGRESTGRHSRATVPKPAGFVRSISGRETARLGSFARFRDPCDCRSGRVGGFAEIPRVDAKPVMKYRADEKPGRQPVDWTSWSA